MTATKRLYQPNLTCSYDVCVTDDNNLWTLVMKNHEDIGITDDQFILELWNFANVFTKRLIEEKMFKLEKDDQIPEAQAIISHNKRYTMYNIVLAAQDKPLTQTTFIVILAELCKNLSIQAGVTLPGLNERGGHATV